MQLSTKQTIQFLFQHTWKQPLLVCLVLGGVTLGIASNIGIAYSIKIIVDTISAPDIVASSIDIWELLWPITLALGLNVLGWRVGIYALVVLEPRVMKSIAKACFDATHKHSYNFFNNEFVGALVKRVTRMVKASESILDLVLIELWSVALRLVFGVIILFWLHPIMGLIMLAWSVVFVWFNVGFSVYKLEKYDRAAVAADSAITAQLADSISNNINIKLFDTEEHEAELFEDVTETWREKATLSWLFNQHAETIQSFLMVGLNIGLLWLAIGYWQDGLLTVGDLVLMQAYLTEVLIFIWDFGRNLKMLFEGIADAEEMAVIVYQPLDIVDAENATDLAVTTGAINFNTVQFAYEEQEEVLHNFNLNISGGETVALIGPSGGGKTTITKLILRLFDIQGGSIHIDNQNIAEVSQNSLRSHIALVPQDPILFHRSLMENIRYGRLDATDEEIYAAAKQAHCHEFITSFPDGYHTLVGERGVKLSGGEKQRIAIARAILSNAKILIFDEATSSLDVQSEELIQDALKNLTKDKTTIIIAHRLSTVTAVDRILVIENGQIVEQGNHTQLLAQRGHYFELWQLSGIAS